MQYVLYKATSPSGKYYVGITNNFKRRIKEHLSSEYSFGNALRKYGRENFSYEFETYDSMEDALKRESELITQEIIDSRECYNECVGGKLSNVLLNNNPMHNPEIVRNHPNIWSSTNNPMHNEESKNKMIQSQTRKRVSIDGVIYDGVREACRQLNTYRQLMMHRLKSKQFPDWYYA